MNYMEFQESIMKGWFSCQANAFGANTSMEETGVTTGTE